MPSVETCVHFSVESSGNVARWPSWTCDQQVAGSNPYRRIIECNSRQVV